MYRIAFIVLFVCLSLTACKPEPVSETSVRPVIVEQVQPMPAVDTASYTGQIHARFETQLSFRVGGKVAERLVGVGDRVAPGQVLAQLDATDIRLSAEAAAAQLDVAREQYALAKQQYERALALHKINAISQSAYDSRKAQLGVAAAQLHQAEKNYAIQKNRLGYTQLRADHAGVITAVQVEPGQVVAAGQPAFGFARAGDRELRISVPEGRIEAIAADEKVTISFWALPDVRVPGRVREIAADADARSRTYEVHITLLEQPESLRLGSTATAHFRDGSSRRVIHLPLTSLYHADGRPAVWVVDPSTNVVALQPVMILHYRDDAVVLDAQKELQTGALVVTKGVSKLHAGQQVKPVDNFFAGDVEPERGA